MFPMCRDALIRLIKNPTKLAAQVLTPGNKCPLDVHCTSRKKGNINTNK
jgi:hypothetical protein